MRLLVVHVQQEGRPRLPVPSVEPVHGLAVDDARPLTELLQAHIPLHGTGARRRPVLLRDEDGVGVVALSEEDVEGGEPSRRRLDVPLAEECGRVPAPVQRVHVRLRVVLELPAQDGHTVNVGVLPGQNRRPGRRAEGKCAEAVLDDGALRGEEVQSRRVRELSQTSLLASEPHGLCGVVVAEGSKRCAYELQRTKQLTQLPSYP